MECCSDKKNKVLWPLTLAALFIVAGLLASFSAEAGTLYSCEANDGSLKAELRDLSGASHPYEVVVRKSGKPNQHWRVRPHILGPRVTYTTDFDYSLRRDSLQLDLGEIAGQSVPSILQANLHRHYDEFDDSVIDHNKREEKLEDIAVTCTVSGSRIYKNSCDGVTEASATQLLLKAAAAADIDSVERSVACGADVNALNARGCTALMLAIEVERRDCTSPQPVTDSLRYDKGRYIFNFLSDNGGYLFPAESVFGQTVAHKIVLNSELELMKTMIALEEDVNVQDKSGSTPLMLAVDRSYPAMIQVLVEGGADLMLTDLQGRSAYDRGAHLPADVRNMLLPVKKELVVEGASNGTCSPLKLETSKGELTKLTLKATGQMFMLTLPQASVSLMASAGGSASKTFKIDKAGTYSFECGVHGGKQNKGQLTVK